MNSVSVQLERNLSYVLGCMYLDPNQDTEGSD